MTSIGTALRAGWALGLRSSLHYLLYRIALTSGWARRSTPIRSWQSYQAELVSSEKGKSDPSFFWDPAEWRLPTNSSWSQAAGLQAEEIGRRVLTGEFRLFGSESVTLGFPPDWHAFAPLAGGESAEPVSADRHWTEYSAERFQADVKLLWEPSRLAWVFHLGRAYRWTDQPDFAAGFWQLFESWQQSHQPNAGPHWLSAQEVAFRIIALGFARACFQPVLAAHQVEQIAAAVGAHAQRIPPTIAYSRAQGNNHLLTEAVGLLTAGLLFPELAQAEQYAKVGYRWLVAGLADQVFEDGGYVQHSTNYGRLALDLGLWAYQLCLVNEQPLPVASELTLARLAGWLAGMVEPDSGHTPNYGSNDGATLLPLTSCGYRDYRPSIQAAHILLGAEALYGPGPWDELALWFGADPMWQQKRPLPKRRDHPRAGIFTFGADRLHGFLRAAHFQSRPGHIDQLHLDIWHSGRNVALDPGTYLYNGKPPWDNRLVEPIVHNTITIDDRAPMTRAGRFLWLDWSEACLEDKCQSEDGRIELMIASHDGYLAGGVQQQRTVVRVGGNLLLVIDDLVGEGKHDVFLPWLLPMSEWQISSKGLKIGLGEDDLCLRVEAQGAVSSLFSAGRRLAGPQLPVDVIQWGWYSSTYAQKEPALHWVSYLRGPLPIQVRSWWCFGGVEPAGLKLMWDEYDPTMLRTVQFGGSILSR